MFAWIYLQCLWCSLVIIFRVGCEIHNYSNRNDFKTTKQNMNYEVLKIIFLNSFWNYFAIHSNIRDNSYNCQRVCCSCNRGKRFQSASSQNISLQSCWKLNNAALETLLSLPALCFIKRSQKMMNIYNLHLICSKRDTSYAQSTFWCRRASFYSTISKTVKRNVAVYTTTYSTGVQREHTQHERWCVWSKIEIIILCLIPLELRKATAP